MTLLKSFEGRVQLRLPTVGWRGKSDLEELRRMCFTGSDDTGRLSDYGGKTLFEGILSAPASGHCLQVQAG